MKNTLYTILLTLIFNVTTIYATPMQPMDKSLAHPMDSKQIQKMDHTLTKHKAIKRNFKTNKEFQREVKRKTIHKNKHLTSNKLRPNTKHYKNGYTYERHNYRDDYRPIRQRGYRHSKRGWVLAYKYDRASFYDNQGYYYGYFNRYGYYFEDLFYRYDRYYTYRDRVRGRGLFDYRYYIPENARYYGFCGTAHSNRTYERGYDRY